MTQLISVSLILISYVSRQICSLSTSLVFLRYHIMLYTLLPHSYSSSLISILQSHSYTYSPLRLFSIYVHVFIYIIPQFMQILAWFPITFISEFLILLPTFISEITAPEVCRIFSHTPFIATPLFVTPGSSFLTWSSMFICCTNSKSSSIKWYTN